MRRLHSFLGLEEGGQVGGWGDLRVSEHGCGGDGDGDGDNEYEYDDQECG